MQLDKHIKQKRSLGALRKNDKTKPKSPDLTGQMKLQRHTAAAIVEQFSHDGIEEVVCNMVTKLDRLGRSTRELLELIERISKAGAAFRSLGDPLWDTSSSQGRLLSTLLAAIADFERDLIRERTGEGRKRAMAAGTKFGRPRKLSDYQRQEAIKRRADGETLAAISKSYGVSIAMISRL